MNTAAMIIGYCVMAMSGTVFLLILLGCTVFAGSRIIDYISRHYRGSHETRN